MPAIDADSLLSALKGEGGEPDDMDEGGDAAEAAGERFAAALGLDGDKRDEALSALAELIAAMME